MYDISREAIINMVKHSRASTLSVILCSNSTHLQLHIQDNGIGFVLPSISDLLTRSHLGLALLQERTQHIQGSLQIETEVHDGTTLIIRVPLDCNLREREEMASGITIVVVDDHSVTRVGTISIEGIAAFVKSDLP